MFRRRLLQYGKSNEKIMRRENQKNVVDNGITPELTNKIIKDTVVA